MPAFFCLALTTATVKSLFTNFRDDPLACIIHEGKEASAFNVVKSRYDTVFQHKKGPHEERYHTTECSI